ncbi:hypothetical protein AAH446_00005, partial [Erwinia sp. P6884]|uniref:hypothetical protein n=1 Tax=Erwinia sp. P6884 TaxID=3141450 RepID=UPI003190D9CD
VLFTQQGCVAGNVGKSRALVNSLSSLFRLFSQFYSSLLLNSAINSSRTHKGLFQAVIQRRGVHNNALIIA